jgi:hypothetical protein
MKRPAVSFLKNETFLPATRLINKKVFKNKAASTATMLLVEAASVKLPAENYQREPPPPPP